MQIRMFVLLIILCGHAFSYEAEHSARIINKTGDEPFLSYKVCLYEAVGHSDPVLKSCEDKKYNFDGTAFFYDENIDYDFENRKIIRFKLLMIQKAESNNRLTVFRNTMPGIPDEDESSGDFVSGSCWTSKPGQILMLNKMPDNRILCSVYP